ncbi:MAG: hypothetical protein K0U78_21000 [Actinomycetia bacterium]|nr:hypothetical protein [Actinomycetes bacterium]
MSERLVSVSHIIMMSIASFAVGVAIVKPIVIEMIFKNKWIRNRFGAIRSRHDYYLGKNLHKKQKVRVKQNKEIISEAIENILENALEEITDHVADTTDVSGIV